MPAFTNDDALVVDGAIYGEADDAPPIAGDDMDLYGDHMQLATSVACTKMAHLTCCARRTRVGAGARDRARVRLL